MSALTLTTGEKELGTDEKLSQGNRRGWELKAPV